MEVKVQFLVVKVNGEVREVHTIRDEFDTISLKLTPEYLTDEDVEKYFSCLSKVSLEAIKTQLHNVGKWWVEDEARLLCCNLPSLTISIETRELEFEPVES